MDPSKLAGAGHTTSGLTEAVTALRALQREDAESNNDASRLTSADNPSAPYDLPPAEKDALVTAMRSLAASQGNVLVATAEPLWLVAALHARKGQVERAVALADRFLRWRVDVCADERTSSVCATMREIFEEGIFMFAGNRARDGRFVLVVRYCKFDAQRFSALDVARSVGFLVEWMLRTQPSVMTHGVVVVEDMAGFSFRNFDRRLISFLEKAFSKVLPVRIAAMYILNPPWYVNIMLAIFSKFLSDKIQARIRVFGKGSDAKFAEIFDSHEVPEFVGLGGTMVWGAVQQSKWVEKVVDESRKW